jgi:hypothetical protein
LIGPTQRPLPHNTNKGQTFMFQARFEPTISVSQRPQTDALDCAPAGTLGGPEYLVTFVFLLTLVVWEGKGKGHPRKGLEGPRGEYRYGLLFH